MLARIHADAHIALPSLPVRRVGSHEVDTRITQRWTVSERLRKPLQTFGVSGNHSESNKAVPTRQRAIVCYIADIPGRIALVAGPSTATLLDAKRVAFKPDVRLISVTIGPLHHPRLVISIVGDDDIASFGAVDVSEKYRVRGIADQHLLQLRTADLDSTGSSNFGFLHRLWQLLCPSGRRAIKPDQE